MSESEYFSIIQDAASHPLALLPNFRYSPEDSPVGLLFAPPSKCDIRFSIGKFKTVRKFQSSRNLPPLPKQWNNYTEDKDDSESVKKQKRLSTRPVNQGHCGSCFAVAIATAISDNFLFGLNLDYNPSISPMYILSCLTDTSQVQQNNRCNGGNPSGVIDYIIDKGGISTNCAQNYYKICNSNKYCNGKGEEHMTITMDKVDQMIPACGKCTPELPKLYKIKNKTISYDPEHIKRHLKQYGTAVGGFLVYPSFMYDKSHGKFSKTKGIFIKGVGYSDNPNYDNNDTPLGGHAITIVGWGVEENLEVELNGTKNTYPKIDYWVCRNSWSENWGDNGYFKYALFQTHEGMPNINDGCAFETDNTKYGQSLGGILMVEPDSVADPSTGAEILNRVDCKVDYTCDAQIVLDPEQKYALDIISHKRYEWLAYACLLGIVMICFKMLFSEKRKRK